MLFASVGQGALFVWMMAAGAAIGAWYALTALLRRALAAGFWLSLAVDLLFGVGCAAILLAALLLGNYGQPRLFALVGALLGLMLSLAGLLSPLRSSLRRLRRKCDKIRLRLSKYRLIKVIFK